MTWVRVDIAIARSRLVDVLRTRCGLSTNEAVGALVRLWAACVEADNHGRLGSLSDQWIEEATGWRGEPGAFAAVIRAQHVASNGTIRDWLDYQGKLEARRAADAARKRAEREAERVRMSSGRANGHPPDTRTDGARTSARYVDVDVDVTGTTTTASAARARLRETLPNDDDRVALDTLLDRVPNPDTWVRKMLGALDGDGHPALGAAKLGAAVSDYVANGKERTPNMREFRKYLVTDDAAPGSRASPNGDLSFVEALRRDDERRAREAHNA